MTLQGGAIDYSDEFVHPSFSASLTEVGGRITGLSSSPESVADVDLRGKLDGVAPLEITGKLNPLAQKLALDLSIMFRDIELSNLSPYSGKYAGYTIAKGKLTLELKYSVQERKLAASNKLFLDQLTLGDRVQNKSATKMPVKLALAVLRDSHGEIHLDLPISGSLDDPKFKVGHVIVQVLLNILTKAVTEPFALLGSLFGRGPELSYLEFGAGHDDVDAAMADKLKVLVKVLTSRPALKLEVTGHVGPDADREGLRRVAFDRKVKAQKVKTLAKQGTAVSESGDDVKFAPDEYERYLRLAYKEEKFPKPRNAIGLVEGFTGRRGREADADAHHRRRRRPAPLGAAARGGGSSPAAELRYLPRAHLRRRAEATDRAEERQSARHARRLRDPLAAVAKLRRRC